MKLTNCQRNCIKQCYNKVQEASTAIQGLDDELLNTIEEKLGITVREYLGTLRNIIDDLEATQ